jgi:adenylyltransferase/sulfurtransferase
MQHISVKELQQKILSQENIILIDVREDFEHEQENMGGHLFPLGEIINHAAEIPKNKPVYIYCKKGIRSQIAIQRLENKFGFTNLINVDGGMEAWKKLY